MNSYLIPLSDENETKKRRTLFRQLEKYLELNEMDVRLLYHPVFEQLKRDSQFDLVIFDYLNNDYYVGIAAHFRCPSIVISNNAINMPTRNFVGNPTSAAFTKSQHVEGPLRMTFWQRVQNHIFLGIEQIFLAAMDRFRSQKYYEQYFPAHLGYPSYRAAKRNISLVLASSSFLQNGPVLSFPAVREIGGINLRQPNLLPTELQEWFDASDEDVIYMSFGSLVNCSLMSARRRDSFLSVFRRLNGTRVLWKWDGEGELPDRPQNVRVGNWFPQSDVLAHPKVKLFISHCGLGGISEARYNAVPVLGIPMFADQFDNVERIVLEGWAKELRMVDVTEETLENAVNAFFADDKLQKRARYASELFRDRPVHPLDEAVYWVEYVLRHDGAEHLQNQALDMNWIQCHSLDVFGFIIGILFVVWNACGWIGKRIFRSWQRNGGRVNLTTIDKKRK